MPRVYPTTHTHPTTILLIEVLENQDKICPMFLCKLGPAFIALVLKSGKEGMVLKSWTVPKVKQPPSLPRPYNLMDIVEGKGEN